MQCFHMTSGCRWRSGDLSVYIIYWWIMSLAIGTALGQVFHTCASVTKQYKLAGKVTIGLASHWPCVTHTHLSFIPYGLNGPVRKMNTMHIVRYRLGWLYLFIFTVMITRCSVDITIRRNMPWSSMMLEEPALAWSSSIFWVMTTTRRPCSFNRNSHSAIATWAYTQETIASWSTQWHANLPTQKGNPLTKQLAFSDNRHNFCRFPLHTSYASNTCCWHSYKAHAGSRQRSDKCLTRLVSKMTIFVRLTIRQVGLLSNHHHQINIVLFVIAGLTMQTQFLASVSWQCTQHQPSGFSLCSRLKFLSQPRTRDFGLILKHSALVSSTWHHLTSRHRRHHQFL